MLIEGAAAAVHADLDVGDLQAGDEDISCELCALVGVEDLGPTLAERLAQGIETEDTVQRVGKLPGEHIATVPVNDSDQVHKATKHRHLGDVCTRDLVDMRNRQIAQEIGIELVALYLVNYWSSSWHKSPEYPSDTHQASAPVCH